jgi:hypothetical protein
MKLEEIVQRFAQIDPFKSNHFCVEPCFFCGLYEVAGEVRHEDDCVWKLADDYVKNKASKNVE